MLYSACGIGNFSVRLRHDQAGIAGKIADVSNEIVTANEQMARQLETIGQVVGRDGNTRKRAKFSLSVGASGDMEASINALVDDLLWPTNTLTRAIAAVARGDLSRRQAQFFFFFFFFSMLVGSMRKRKSDEQEKEKLDVTEIIKRRAKSRKSRGLRDGRGGCDDAR